MIEEGDFAKVATAASYSSPLQRSEFKRKKMSRKKNVQNMKVATAKIYLEKYYPHFHHLNISPLYYSDGKKIKPKVVLSTACVVLAADITTCHTMATHSPFLRMEA